MKVEYDQSLNYLPVRVEVLGPNGIASELILALDTGAAKSLITPQVLKALGYDPTVSVGQSTITTVSGIEYVNRIRLSEVRALGQTKLGLEVVAHSLPPNAPIDGLLGLDFIQGHVLTIDTNAHTIELI